MKSPLASAHTIYTEEYITYEKLSLHYRSRPALRDDGMGAGDTRR